MNRVTAFFNRQQGISQDCSYDFALRRLCVAKEDSWRGIAPSVFSADFNPEPPLFAAKFANCQNYRHILAIANEDGKIALQDITLRNTEPEERALVAKQCHFNAVFDLEWAPGQMKFVSASGDHTACLWQVKNEELCCIRQFAGHTRSVKTAAFHKTDDTIFATGGRDGAILIWDTRANLNIDLTPRADNYILHGHHSGAASPLNRKRRPRTPKLTASMVTSSITGLVFQDANTLISCGAGDGVIKVWDLRRNYTALKKEPLPKHSLPYAGRSTFQGFTSLAVDKCGTRLFANCMDHTIYSYNLHTYDPQPLAMYKGLQNSTYYIKCCLSPDNKYLMSGSSDEKAYIWNLNYAEQPLVALSGHNVEVTCVAWCATGDQALVTCSDDARHKIWRIGPDQLSDSARYCGHAEYVRDFTTKSKPELPQHNYFLRDLDTTPRSQKRVVEQNERTPGAASFATKRNFLEMLGAASSVEGKEEQQQQQKRIKVLEPRARRLFSPCTSSAAHVVVSETTSIASRSLSTQFSAQPADTAASTSAAAACTATSAVEHFDSNQENANISPLTTYTTNKSCHYQSPTVAPLSERAIVENSNHAYVSPTAPTEVMSASTCPTPVQQSALATVIFSPTSNLPNYVLDGDAPHLGVMSPKRKHREKIDWLTKLRKQKLMSAGRSTTLTEKINEQGNILSSPRLQNLRLDEGSPRLNLSPRRRNSHHHHAHEPQSPATPSSSHIPKTPTTSRRNSETTLLRFFTVQKADQMHLERSAPLTPQR